MSWTYSGDPANSAADAVRFLVQDTDSARPLATDEEIAWALSEHNDNAYRAAAAVARSLGAASGNVARKRVGEVTIAYDPEFYRSLAAALEGQAVRAVSPWAGGISHADKEARELDTDRVEPSFTRRLHRLHPLPDIDDVYRE